MSKQELDKTMPFHFKHIIFSSEPIQGIDEASESIVVESTLSSGGQNLDYRQEYLPEQIRLLSYALTILGYEPKVVYEVFNPNNAYENLTACNGNVDYIFSVKDGKFMKMLEKLKYEINRYADLSATIAELDDANSKSVKSFVALNQSSAYPKSTIFMELVQEVLDSEEGILSEMVLAYLKKYLLYPIVD